MNVSTMLANRNLVIDTMSEVYNELKPYSHAEFWNFAEHQPIPNSVYVLGRQQVVENQDKFKAMAQDPQYTMIFGNSAEGSSTLIAQIKMLGLEELVLQKKILLISGGDMESTYPFLLHDHFLVRILDYDENLDAVKHTDKIFNQQQKPYKFLFLNGRARPHRKYLWEKFKRLGLLEQSLWTMLDSRPTLSNELTFVENDINVMATVSELRWLPAEYEVEQYKNSTVEPGPAQRTFVKNQLFNNTWGEIYLDPRPYIDSYFSLVTETVFEYPYSFRTEKTAKPLAMGHPWICATSAGWYRDFRNLGFRTFDHLIDESFDSIDNNQARMNRIIDTVQDLCRQDLVSFLQASEEVCKYNQQHLFEFAKTVRGEFPTRFFNFVKPYINE